MAQGDNGEIGLVIPAESEQNLGEGQSLELRGYVLWASRSNASRLKTDLEQRLTELNGQPVSIMIKDTVIPQPGAMGPIRMASLTLVVTITFIGVFSVPHLMLEEKQTKTLDTLLISPASIIQVITGKALAGMFYCLVIGVTVLAFNQVFVVHWGLVMNLCRYETEADHLDVGSVSTSVGSGVLIHDRSNFARVLERFTTVDASSRPIAPLSLLLLNRCEYFRYPVIFEYRFSVRPVNLLPGGLASAKDGPVKPFIYFS
jgi:hypothetical protein